MIKAPKAEKEDPAVTAARDREQKRAEAQRTEETQGFLLSQTVRRLRRFGRLTGVVGSVAGGGGSVPLTVPGGGTGGSFGGFGSVTGGGAVGNAALAAAFGNGSLAGSPGGGVASY